MKYFLTKKPKSAIIIQGFPSLGLVSTIATKFLIDHLEVEQIGKIDSDRLFPLTAIHKAKLIDPITIYYNKKFNLVLIQAITEIRGLEWDLADTIIKLAKELKSKEVITIEGMPGHQEKLSIYSYCTKNKSKTSTAPLNEGIIMGVTAAMLLKSKEVPITCFFAETHSQLPDSEAAARVVEALDEHLNLKIDFKPLLEAAKQFESNLKKYMEKVGNQPAAEPQIKEGSSKMSKKEKKELSYFG